jgi:NADPH:quinone reductase-like Zn-dependent oxidoreductase
MIVAIEMLAAGDLKIIVDSIYSLEDGLKAFERLSEGKANGKVVIRCQCS